MFKCFMFQSLTTFIRVHNSQGIGLDKAGVTCTSRGIVIDDYLRTSNKSIFAVGDVCSKYQFTHVADFMARKVVRNALFFKPTDKLSSMQVPWSTYTSPEIAHVGAYEHELEDTNVAYDTYMVPLSDVDRAILEGDREKSGFVKITCKKKSDQIVGATVVAENAGDIISEISVAMQSKIGLAALSKVIHPYPTVADAVRKCGDQYNRTRLSPAVKSVFRYLMKQQR
jgi:pyruvate/2-oxoglutarate dehydrogenase complex dihydrolipoamide dehydrogenase (E3) component